MTSATMRPKYLSPEIRVNWMWPDWAAIVSIACLASSAADRIASHFDFSSGVSTPRMRT